MADDRWLVVGLGNPGRRYAGTRHNVGAELVRVLAARIGVRLKANKRVRCDVAEGRLVGAGIVLAVPDAYMNLSGGPTQAAAAWFKVPLERLVVAHDDLDVPVGGLRVKRGGSAAGHRGLADIDRALGSNAYLRLRIGIGRPPERVPARDFVLQRFGTEERAIIDGSLDEAGDAVASLVGDGLEATQNRFHRKS